MSIARHPLIMFGTKPAAASSFLLDTYTGAIVAVSLRQLKSGETTPARITNSLDSTEADYTVSDIDAGLTAIGSNSGTIAKLYDQANANDLQQTVLASQMVIKNASTMQTLNSKPAMNNTADFGLQTAGSVALSSFNELWMFFVVGASSGIDNILLETSANFNLVNGAIAINMATTTILSVGFSLGGGGTNYSVKRYTISQPSQQLISLRMRTGQTFDNASQLWINGVEQTNYTSASQNNSPAFTNQTLNLFARNATSLRYNNNVQEAIIFSGDQSANRAAIEANINAYYGIY